MLLGFHRSIVTACALAMFSAALLAPRAAWAPSCAVIDFSAVKQRTKTVIGSTTVSTLIAAPAAAPGDFVLLEADFGCVVGQGFDSVSANNAVSVEVLKSGSTAFLDSSLSTSFESFAVPSASVLALDCAGPKCNALRFLMPDSGFAGPARITVKRGVNVVAQIFEIGARTASCDVDAIDTLFGTFTLLPNYNALAASVAGELNVGLKGALAGNGSLLLPLQHNLVGEAAVDATATRSTGTEIDKIPNGRFLRALSTLFRPLPAIHRLVPFGVSGQALYSTADVARSTLQVLQNDPSGPEVYPDNFHSFRQGAAGPVVFPNPVTVRFEGASPVVSLRSSAETVAIGLSEELLGDLNGDTDGSDLLLAATDLPSGDTTETGQAIALIAASPLRPVLAVVGDIVAFPESEARSAYADLNGDGQRDDQVVRVLKAGLALNPGAPVDTSMEPRSSIDGSQLAISDGFVFFRTPENATAPHSTQRVSDTAGTGGDDTSEQPSLDGPGTRVAYASHAANLAAGTNGAFSQILVSDRVTGLHTLVSAGSSGAGNADSFDAAISRDGYDAAFASLASNFNGGFGSEQVVWERGENVNGSSAFGLSFATFGLAAGEEDVAGVDYSPCTASSPGISLSFSNDGSVTGFLATSGGGGCAFSADFTGTYAIAPLPVQVGSVLTVDTALTDFSGVPPLPGGLSDLRLFGVNTVTAVGPVSFDFSGDFALLASEGVPSPVAQVFARALGGAAPLELVSGAAGGGAGSAASGQPALSADGNLVAFASAAPDLILSDSNSASDIFVRDRTLGSTVRVSLSNGGAQANGASSDPAISPDGILVAFASSASNLIGAGADTNNAKDVFLRDRGAASTKRVSVPAPGGSAAGASSAPDMSDDARYVVFESAAALVPADTNNVVDVYLRDRQAQTTERVSVATGGEQADDASFDPAISGDGTYVVFASLASNLVPGAPAGSNVYRRNRLNGSVELLSDGAMAGDASTSPDASTDGRTVAFDSDASLVLNDSLPVDVFVRVTGFGTDLNGDGDDADSVLQSFATDPTPGLQPGARVAASSAVTGAGRVLASVPEAAEGNTNHNATSLIVGAAADGDTDAGDAVLHLYDGATATLVNLGIAGTQGAISATTLCALVNESQQNGSDLNGQNGATESVLVAGDVAALLAAPGTKSLTNVGIAATQVHVAGTVCVFTRTSNGILTFYDTATAKLVSSGLQATAVMVGPNDALIAFRVPENGGDLNNDGDGVDEVMHAVAVSAVLAAAPGAVITGDITNLGLQAIDCTLPGCEAFNFGAILVDGSISFLGTEPGESIDVLQCLATNKTGCDFNGDSDALDTVVHFVTTLVGSSPPQVSSMGALAISTAGGQETNPFPVTGPHGTAVSIQGTECEIAKIVCPETRSKVNDPIGPPLTSCEGIFDVDVDGVLDCTTLRNFVGLDSDGDGIIDPFDNAIDTSNPTQGDADGDGVGDAVDTVVSVPPCQKSCDLNEDSSIDQLDVDAILAAVTAGGQAAGGTTTPQCGDRRDRDASRVITFLDASLCKAACDRADCSPPAAVPAGGPPAPAPACGLGIELLGLLPALMAARRWRKRS